MWPTTFITAKKVEANWS